MTVQAPAPPVDDTQAAPAAAADDLARWAGTPLATLHWLETANGFPAGSVGERGLGGDDVVAATRGITLTRRQVDEVLAFAEFLTGAALPAADLAELADDIVDAFEDSPLPTVRALRPLADGVHRVRVMDPVERAGRRVQALATTYGIQLRRLADGDDPSPVMDVVLRRNPVVRHWSAASLVLVEDVLAARLDQHRLVHALVGRTLEDPAGLRARLLAVADESPAVENGELVASQVRLLCLRAWLRDLGDKALARVRSDLDRALASALDTDIVVQQLGYRASLAVGARLTEQARARQAHRPRG
ncbi:MAG: hypothetical protein ACFCVF_10665 [Kineosporiaceae bacterium]